MTNKIVRRQGRGRLSSVEQLPAVAQADVDWATCALRDRHLAQNEIFVELNARLAAHDLAPISKSAWSRYAVRKEKDFRQVKAARELSSALFGADRPDAPGQMPASIAGKIMAAATALLYQDAGAQAAFYFSLGGRRFDVVLTASGERHDGGS